MFQGSWTICISGLINVFILSDFDFLAQSEQRIKSNYTKKLRLCQYRDSLRALFKLYLHYEVDYLCIN